MNAFATTTVSVLRGTSTDAFGDEYDNGTVESSGNPASIMQRDKRVFDPASSESRIVSYFSGRMDGTTDVADTDRLLDEGSGAIYVIEAVTRPSSPVHLPDVHLDLRRVNV